MKKVFIIIAVLLTAYIVMSFVQYFYYQSKVRPGGECEQLMEQEEGNIQIPPPGAHCYWYYDRNFWQILSKQPRGLELE
jgi:hypothetical protein